MLGNALLRQQVIVLQRQVKRPKLSNLDRRLMVLLTSQLRAWCSALLVDKPETLPQWHRDLFRLVGRHRSTGHGGEMAPSSQVGMMVCPVCGLLNLSGSLACSRCGTDCALTEITLHLHETLAVPQFARIPTRRLFASRQTHIVLKIDGLPLTVPMADVITVGRGARIVESQPGPDVDLSLFGAALKGVSRRHIKLTRDKLLVRATDLDSTNGTWLNGQPIRPYGWRILRDGDELQLRFSLGGY